MESFLVIFFTVVSVLFLTSAFEDFIKVDHSKINAFVSDCKMETLKSTYEVKAFSKSISFTCSPSDLAVIQLLNK